jgi:hypothetical protein
MMVAHRFTVEQMAELVRAGEATATAVRIVMGPCTVEVARVRITDAGGGRSLRCARHGGRSQREKAPGAAAGVPAAAALL